MSSDSIVPGRPAPATPRLSLARVLLGSLAFLGLLAALSIRSGLVFGLIILAAIFIPLERLFAARRQRVLRDGWRTDVVHFGVNTLLTNVGLVIPVVTVGLLLRAAVPGPVHQQLAAQPKWLQFAGAMVIAELGGYAGHRAAHRVPLLWRFHKVHHSIREMDWLAAAHLHPIDQVWIRSCSVLPIFALGFSRATFGAYLTFATVQAIFIHANVRLRFGPLRWIIATPEFHHWHHSSDPQAFNSNFAGEFPWIDALFGTLTLPVHTSPSSYGIAETQPPGYVRQLAWPFGKVTL